MDLRNWKDDILPGTERSLLEVAVALARCGGHRVESLVVRDLGIRAVVPDANRWPKDRHRFAPRRIGRILKEVGSFVWQAAARNHQIKIAIAVIVHRQGPSPETDTEIDGESGVVVANALEFCRREM